MLESAAIPIAIKGINTRNVIKRPVIKGSVKYLSGSKTGVSVSFP